MAANKILPVRLPIDWKISHPIIQDLLSKLKSAVNSNIDDISTLTTTVSGISGSGWTMVSKTANASKTSDTTYADDATLKFTVAASTKYRFRGAIYYNAGASAGIKYQLVGPTLGSGTLGYEHYNTAPSAGSTVTFAYNTLYSINTQIPSAGGGLGHIMFNGFLHNDVTAGTVVWQWAQNASSGNATSVLAGSYLEWIAV